MPLHNQSRARLCKRILSGLAIGVLIAAMVSCTPPKSGGGSDSSNATLKYGMIGNKNDEKWPYLTAFSSSQTMKNYELYDTLMTNDRTGKVHKGLASQLNPRNNYKEWDIHLRNDVKFSNKEKLDAKDVVFSIKQWFSKKHATSAKTFVPMIDPKNVSVKNKHVVNLKLKHSFAPLPDVLAYADLIIISNDSTYNHPIGSGPFKLANFKADSHATFTRNRNYWGKKPNFKTLKVNYFKEHDAILNALKSDQIDIAHSVKYNQISEAKSSNKKVVAPDSASYPMIEMRTDVKPFDDKRVRRAFQLMVDRKRVIKNAFSGYARLGNDYVANNDQCGKTAVKQRRQDLKKAKKLLTQAGRQNMTVKLQTDGASAGMKEMAEVFA